MKVKFRFDQAYKFVATLLILVMVLSMIQTNKVVKADVSQPLAQNPQWKILVLIYTSTDFTYSDASGQHRVLANMTQSEIDRAVNASHQFAESDIPALTSGYMVPLLTIRYPNHALTGLDPFCGYWPDRLHTSADLDPSFDSVIVIWDDSGTDITTGQPADLQGCGGLAVSNGTGQTYSTFPVDSVKSNERNVFKHEWGHSILFYFEALGVTPQPTVDNHINDTTIQYVHCPSGTPYILQDETDDNPIPNSIYNNSAGFTHDYYSGTTAKPENPSQCLGIDETAWSYGGPVTGSSTTPNLLMNAGFEDDANNDGKPDIWSTNAKFTRSNEITAFDGIYIGRFRATDNSGATIQQTVANLTAGSTYNFSGRVNIPATSDAFTFKLQVKWRNASNGTISTKVIKNYMTSTGGWNEATASLVAPAGTTNALVQMIVSSLNGTIYVDKFSLGGSGPTYTLTVNKTGTGSGSVISSPVGINCGSDCSESYSSGTTVTLAATANAGSAFTGWNGGGCSGTGDCTVTINANTTVSADFAANPSPPDLIIQSITSAPSDPQVNESVTFSVVIKNQGSGPASSFWVGSYVDTDFPAVCGASAVDFRQVDSLPAGASQTVTFDWDGFTTAGDHSFGAMVDTHCEISESAEGNNTSSISVSVGGVFPPGTLIFEDNFETEDRSFYRWTSCATDGNDLSITAAARYAGNYGMQAVIDDNVLINCTSDHPDAEIRYLASFRFHPNSIQMTSGDTHVIFGGYSGTSTMVLRVQFRKSSGNYQVQAGLFKDGSGWTSTSWQTISGNAYHLIELDWKAATGVGANNGSLLFKVDGAQLPELTGVDNDTRRIDRARLGVVNAIDTGTRGTYYFDNFVSSSGDEVPRGVSVVGASTVDENWNPKTNFAPGDTIQWVLEVQNDTGQAAQIELTIDVRGPNGEQIMYSNSIVTTDPGHVGWGLPGTVQSGLDGTYTWYGSVLYQGTLSEASSTYTVTTATDDTIFVDGFESGNFSAWTSNTSDGSDLSVTTAAKYAGNHGMQALIDDKLPIFVSDGTPNVEPRYRARFYFNRNTVSMVNGNAHFIFKGFAGTDASPVELLRVEVRRSSNIYQLRASLVNDGTAWTHTAWVNLPDGWNSIEVDWRAASGVGANNGGLTLWIGGVQKANITNIDNDTRRIDFVRLGALNGIDPEIQGTYYFDAFESRRQTYIGP